MNLSREICIYEKFGDALIESYQIDISLDKIIEIFGINIKNDPCAYNVYEVQGTEYEYLKLYLPEIIKYNIRDFAIYYECYQI